MKFRKLLSALLLTTGVLFVAGFTPAESPAAVARKCFNALANCDFDTAAKLCDGQLKTELSTIGDIYRTGDAGRRQEMRRNAASSYGSIKISGEKIEGDFAVIDVVQVGQANQQYLKMVNGEWKLIADSEYRKQAVSRNRAASPCEVVDEYINAIRNCDFVAAADTCCGKIKNDMQQMDRQYKAATPEQQKQMRQFMLSLTYGVVLKSEKIDGDFAVVEIVQNGKPDKAYLKKIDGEWKVIHSSEYKK